MSDFIENLIIERNYIEAKLSELEDYYTECKQPGIFFIDSLRTIALQIDTMRAYLKCLNYRLDKFSMNDEEACL